MIVMFRNRGYMGGGIGRDGYCKQRWCFRVYYGVVPFVLCKLLYLHVYYIITYSVFMLIFKKCLFNTFQIARNLAVLDHTWLHQIMSAENHSARNYKCYNSFQPIGCSLTVDLHDSHNKPPLFH